jgi:hypothetical protein
MRYLAIPIVVGLMVFAACVNTTDPGDGVPHDRTTVLGTLLLFVDVWNDCDIDTYKGLLDEDDFIFYFDPQDVDWGLPPSWDYDAEIQAVGNLFDAIGAENVDVELDLDDVAEPEGDVDTYTVTDIPYDVRVCDEDAEWGPTVYIATGLLDMEFEYTDGGWVITKWWDKAGSLLAGVCETSWGALKAEF